MFYLKLAGQNIRKSLSTFSPFVLSSIVLFTLLCSIFQLMLSPVMASMGAGAISLGLGVIVLTIFSLIMEIYSFNFLMKQRSREFGLYNMLGMNKKKVSLIATLELMMIFILVVVAGSIFSTVFSNVFYLIFANLINYTELHFSVNSMAFFLTAVIFGAIFFLLELLAVRTISQTTPLILFRSREAGEKEPKGNLLFAALAILFLGVGYYLSLSSTAKGVGVLYLFFIAVLFVIAGTYLFYISFVTWYLKTRRKNKQYFYQPEHFITTSQMIFRMKQHATGLANITLLAVMAFVTIATTTSLYTGMSTSIDNLYPKETSLTYPVNSRSDGETALEESVLSHFPEKAQGSQSYLSFTTGIMYDGGEELLITPENLTNPNYNQLHFTTIVTQEDLVRLGNDLPQLEENQVLFYLPDRKAPLQHFSLGDKNFEVLASPDKIEFPGIANTYNPALLVVSNDQVMAEIKDYTDQYKNLGTPSSLDYTVFMDLSLEDMQSLSGEQVDNFPLTNASGEVVGYATNKESFRQELLGFTGGFLFTGFLLGISFLLGAALIIYYKQYSEGTEDKKSYKILQEVGMSKQAVKKAISSQILLVFFLPLAMAILHFVISLVMLKQMLIMFGVTSSTMIYTVSGATILGICLLYYLIYKLTSRTYYRIIER